MLSREIVDSLFPPDLPEPEQLERRYPPRSLPPGAEVTRFSPSPTGFLHIGGVYTAMIDADVAAGGYGPYTQSARERIYLSYVRELLRQGKAYPCFETREQAEERTARQRAAGALPGYYGQWATWRDAPQDR